MSRQYSLFFIVLASCLISCSMTLSTDRSDVEPPAANGRSTTPDEAPKDLRMKFVDSSAPSELGFGSFVDDQFAWILAGSNDLRRTLDGGISWQRLVISEGPMDTLGPLVEVYKIAFHGPSNGWILASTGTWETHDGGLTWHSLFPSGSSMPVFADNKNGWLIVDDPEERNLITTDGGLSWHECASKKQKSGIKPTENATFIGRVGWAISIEALEDKNDRYAVSTTDDRGCSWNAVWSLTENPDERLREIQFVDIKNGFLVTDFQILGTKTGGKTWHPIFKNKDSSKVISAFFESPTFGWILVRLPDEGKEVVLNSTDGGNHWRAIPETEIDSIKFPNRWKIGRLFYLRRTGKLPM